MKKFAVFSRWTARMLAIVAILFISLFALDSFDPSLSIWMQIAHFLVHLIPSFVLLAVLIIAWKRELLGGVIFLIIGLALSPFIYRHNFGMNHSVATSLMTVLIVNVPFILTGLLFIWSHFLHRKAVGTQAGASE
jgi:hypothetical protein